MPDTSYEGSPPALAEIARTIQDFRTEFRTTILDMVRRDVYQAEQQALRDRVAVLEQERKATRQVAWASALTAIVSVVILLLQAAISR